MRKRWLAIVPLAVLAAVQDVDVWAHGGSRRSGFSGHHGGARFAPRHQGFTYRPAHVYPRAVFVAPALFFPPVYYAPPVFYPPAAYYPAPPPTYVEQPKAGYWYFCPDSRQYYPSVQECPSGWLMVPPSAATPPPPP